MVRARIAVTLLALTSLFGSTNATAQYLGPVKLQTSSDKTVTATALRRQYDALVAMPSVKVAYTQDGKVERVQGDIGWRLTDSQRAAKAGDPATEFVPHLKDLAMLEGSETLIVASNEVYGSGGVLRTIRLKQSIRGIPVFDGAAAIGSVEKTQMVNGISLQLLADRGLPAQPKLDADAGIEALKGVLTSYFKAAPASIRISGKPSLAYYGASPSAERRTLAWLIRAEYVTDAGDPQFDELQIDAINGDYLGKVPLAKSLISRTAYSANHTIPTFSSMPGSLTLIFDEASYSPTAGDTSAQSAWGYVKDAYDALAAQFSLVQSSLGIVTHATITPPWNAINGNGADGKRYLVFGEGTVGTVVPAENRDAVAHEYGHTLFDSYHYVGGTPEGFAMSEAYADLAPLSPTAT